LKDVKYAMLYALVYALSRRMKMSAYEYMSISQVPTLCHTKILVYVKLRPHLATPSRHIGGGFFF
jgi:hypothetical protein